MREPHSQQKSDVCSSGVVCGGDHVVCSSARSLPHLGRALLLLSVCAVIYGSLSGVGLSGTCSPVAVAFVAVVYFIEQSAPRYAFRSCVLVLVLHPISPVLLDMCNDVFPAHRQTVADNLPCLLSRPITVFCADNA
jgi:hypothetical protein